MGHGRAVAREVWADWVFTPAGLPRFRDNGMSGAIPRASNAEFVG
jgi:hypothetical protein